MGPLTPNQRWEDLSLWEIATRMGADKLKHNFGPHYERHFAPLRSEPIHLLEIGVKRGGSIATWERYFPKASIYGMDISEGCSEFASDRCRIFIGDQADRAFLAATVKQIGAPLDVIIDDGGHDMHQQRLTMEVLFEHLRPGGLYVVEDIHTSYREKHGGGPPGKAGTFIEALKAMVDDVHYALLDKHGVQAKYPLAEMHVYQSICFLRKRDDSAPKRPKRFRIVGRIRGADEAMSGPIPGQVGAAAKGNPPDRYDMIVDVRHGVFEMFLPIGDYRLVASLPGFRPKQAEVSLQQNHKLDMTFGREDRLR